MIQRFNILQQSSQDFEASLIEESKRNPFVFYSNNRESSPYYSSENEGVSPIDFATYDESLISVLTNQLDRQFLSEKDYHIVLSLIDACDDYGFIKNYKDIRPGIMAEFGIDEREVFRCLKILQSFNMSFGINILRELVKKTAKNISEESDIEISETHHNLKRDIPSGTALTLADSINEGAKVKKKHSYRLQSANLVRKKNEIGFSSIRGGDVVGEHSVYFFLDGERIELTHRALDRKIFSNGALRAAVWIFKKKPGMYSLIDVLG